MFADGADASVAQVVDIVNLRLGVDEFHQITDDGDNVLIREHARFHRDVKIQFLVDAVASHLAEIITLLGEEELVERGAGRLLIGSLCALELHVDILDGLLARVGGILLQRVEDHGIVNLLVVLLVEKHGLDVGVGHHVDVIFLKDGLAVDNHLGTLDVDHLTSLVIHKVLIPRLGDGGR